MTCVYLNVLPYYVQVDESVIKGALYSSYKAFQNIVCFALKEMLWSLN